MESAYASVRTPVDPPSERALWSVPQLLLIHDCGLGSRGLDVAMRWRLGQLEVRREASEDNLSDNLSINLSNGGRSLRGHASGAISYSKFGGPEGV